MSFNFTNYLAIKKQLPEGVAILAAAKTRTATECEEAISHGLKLFGMNYLQEGLALKNQVKSQAEWHFIGALQTNKLKTIVENFDLIQTVSREKELIELDKRAQDLNKVVPLLLEINSAEEDQKHGLAPKEMEAFIKKSSLFTHLEIRGLMTMGPAGREPSEMRPFFKLTKQLFEALKSISQDNLKPTILSMGMSDSWREALDEGSTMIRLGTVIFGERAPKN